MKSLLNFVEPDMLKEDKRPGRALQQIVGRIHINPELPVQAKEKSKWTVLQNPERLVRSFEFSQYKFLKAFLNILMNYQEKIHHHSTIIVQHRKIDIEVYTHDLEEVTERDRELAKFIDVLFEDVQYYFLTQDDSGNE